MPKKKYIYIYKIGSFSNFHLIWKSLLIIIIIIQSLKRKPVFACIYFVQYRNMGCQVLITWNVTLIRLLIYCCVGCVTKGEKECHLVSVKSCPEEIEKNRIMWQRLYISSHLSNTSWNGRRNGMNTYVPWGFGDWSMK